MSIKDQKYAILRNELTATPMEPFKLKRRPLPERLGANLDEVEELCREAFDCACEMFGPDKEIWADNMSDEFELWWQQFLNNDQNQRS